MEKIMSFEEFENKDLKHQYIVEFDCYSNSGNTYYGREVVIREHDIMHKSDQLIFSKKYTELNTEEKEKYKNVIDEYYLKYKNCLERSNEEERKTNEFIKENIHIIDERSPFIFIDDYDTFRFYKSENEIEPSVRNGNRLVKINSHEDLLEFNDYQIKYILLALKNDLTSIETW